MIKCIPKSLKRKQTRRSHSLLSFRIGRKTTELLYGKSKVLFENMSKIRHFENKQ